jgi:tetratricopeptide (TPR) repeat protein
MTQWISKMSGCAVEHSNLQPTATAASIFISYASKDHAAAHTICNALEHRGFDCWIADRDIGPGENFQVAIVHAIRSAKVMILVFSANATNSEEIKKEVVLAGQSRLVVIPVRVEDVTPDEAFAYEMATRQWIDLFGDWEQSVQRLVRQLETVTHIKPDLKVAADTPIALAPSFPKPAAESSPPSKPAAPSPKKLDWRLIAAPGGTAAVIAAVLALWLSFGHSNSLVLQPNLSVVQAVREVELQKGREAYQRRDYAEAMRWYRKAADQGNADAQFDVGWLYKNGWGVPQDYAEALRWCHNAADQGNVVAQNNIGRHYENGWGVAQDYAEAMRWFRKAADRGNATAQANIGVLYQNGWGVAQDSAEARAWMQKAAAAGDDNAKRWLVSHQGPGSAVAAPAAPSSASQRS